MSRPAVSVVIPTYDRLAYLTEAIDSVRAQTFGDWELIVVDDGSTDGSAEWIESLHDPRIVVIRRPHTGNRSALRNCGVARSSADWIAFLDSDDLWEREKLAVQFAEISVNPVRRWSCTGVRFIDGQGEAVEQRAGPPYRAQSGWILEQLLTFTATATMPTLMVKRSLFDEIGGFDESFLLREDYEFELRLAARSEIHALQQPLTIVRHHPGRTSSNRRVADLHRGSAMVYRKVAATAADERIRAIARRESAVRLAESARALSREGTHVAALIRVGEAIREHPGSLVAWRAAAGCLVRAVLRRRPGAHASTGSATAASTEPAA